MSRRTLLLSAGAIAAAAAGGFAAFALTREPHRANAPWRETTNRRDDPRLFALAHAILAPNPHNRQPWLAEPIGHDQIRLFCDLDRRLPQTDPFDRQITIGMGCFIELAAIAATEIGMRMAVELFPEGAAEPRLDRRPVAQLTFIPDRAGPRDPLFAAIANRRSTKEPFDLARPIPDALVTQLRDAAGPAVACDATTAPARVAALRTLAWKGFETEMRTPHAYRESVDLMRIGKAEIEAHPDGIDLGGPLFEVLRLAGQLTRAKLADPGSSAFQQGLDAYHALFAASPGFFWIATSGNRRSDQIAAGRAYARANLAATRAGLAMHPVSQTLQEFAEMKSLAAAMHTTLDATAGRRVQMLARIGFGPAVAPSPRWPLDSRLKTS